MFITYCKYTSESFFLITGKTPSHFLTLTNIYKKGKRFFRQLCYALKHQTFCSITETTETSSQRWQSDGVWGKSLHLLPEMRTWYTWVTHIKTTWPDDRPHTKTGGRCHCQAVGSGVSVRGDVSQVAREENTIRCRLQLMPEIRHFLFTHYKNDWSCDVSLPLKICRTVTWGVTLWQMNNSLIKKMFKRIVL